MEREGVEREVKGEGEEGREESGSLTPALRNSAYASTCSYFLAQLRLRDVK